MSSVKWNLLRSIRTQNLKVYYYRHQFHRYGACAVKWLNERVGVLKLAFGSPSFFTGPMPNLSSTFSTGLCLTTMFYIFDTSLHALSNSGVYCLRLDMTFGANFGVFGPRPFSVTLLRNRNSECSAEYYARWCGNVQSFCPTSVKV